MLLVSYIISAIFFIYWFLKLLSFFPVFKGNQEDADLAGFLHQKISAYANQIIASEPWKKNKNILFIDFNGVISYNPFWITFRKTHTSLFNEIEQKLFRWDKTHIIQWMKGEKSSEDICKWLANELNHPYDDILDTLVKDSKNMDVSNVIFHELKHLKEHYILVLVTDNMDSFDRWTMSTNAEYFSIFDAIFNSAEAWIFKKEEECKIFMDYISKYSAEAGNCILIDDSLNNRNAFEEHVWGMVFDVKNEGDAVDVLRRIQERIQSKWIWQY